LSLIGDDRTADSLVNAALTDTDESVRIAARKALENIDPDWTEKEKARGRAPEFVSELESENEAIRKLAAEALLHIGDERAIGPLIRAMKDKNDDIGGLAVEALTKIDPLWPQREEVRGYFAELIHAVEYGNKSVRDEAAAALGILGERGH